MEGYLSAGGDPDVLRLALHPRIPLSYAEAEAAPVRVIQQLIPIADGLDRIARLEAFGAAARAAHDAAVRQHLGGRR